MVRVNIVFVEKLSLDFSIYGGQFIIVLSFSLQNLVFLVLIVVYINVYLFI